MAKVEKEKQLQVAQCIGSNSYGSEGEERYIYEFCFIDNPSQTFSVFPTKYFIPEVDKFYTPVVVLYSQGYKDKKDPNKIRTRNALTVNWEEHN